MTPSTVHMSYQHHNFGAHQFSKAMIHSIAIYCCAGVKKLNDMNLS